MKNLTIIILFLACSQLLLAQSDTAFTCGTEPASYEEISKRSYFGNNRQLIDVLERHGLHLPKDYFDQLDSKGLYKGRELSLDEVRKKNSPILPDGVSNGRITSSGGSTYYIPLKIWV